MELLLNREPTVTRTPPDYVDHDVEAQEETFGALLVDGQPFCYTMEDAIRPEKIAKKTCVGPGRYRIKMRWSIRFKRVIPEITNVPNFTGILMHNGCTAHDTEGCVLVGLDRHDTYIARSRDAVDKLVAAMQKADAAGEEIWITIMNPEAARERVN